MPIDRDKYPVDWDQISYRIRKERAQDKCECTGICGLHEGGCEAVNAQPHPVTGSKVVLTVAHLDQDTWNNVDRNLLAMCQRCHLTYDRHYYEKQELAWIKTLGDGDLEVLFTVIEDYSTDVVGEYSGARARGIWGEEFIERLEKLHALLEDEWEARHDPPPNLKD